MRDDAWDGYGYGHGGRPSDIPLPARPEPGAGSEPPGARRPDAPPSLLSRVAESLFWMGRYVERADDTARLLDAFVHRMVEDPWTDEPAACRSLLGVLGLSDAPPGPTAPFGPPLDTQATIRRIAFDEDSPSSITGALLLARENARGVREVVSSEIWECLNVTRHGLAASRRSAEQLGPAAFLTHVRERAALFSGLADATLSRDEGWRFLVLGRSLERADMTARLLSVFLTGDGPMPDRTTLLRAAGAEESFLRTYGGAAGTDRAVEFLLLDRLFPRSVLHALSTAEECLLALGPAAAERTGVADEARRPVGRLRTRLEYADVSAFARELPTLLGDLGAACAQATDAVARRFFPDAPLARWEGR
ncbi:alpha-E domain-containing protein [Yinghuangia soli]|uniref:Alpha-E domain-containing protein n=1 Tax=Yinghuangia soli TaxID=2908204 RepID=A0AA41Q2K6_9ACTN|nr:alpha-E domain-containing protein [Yinghuangia soli]MCF2528942.1 alpha-E domain-containing protein [Yinghuangia soli]